MNRNIYSKEFEKEMVEKSKTCTFDELLEIAKNYNYDINKKKLMSYLSKRNIKYKDYNNNMVRNMGCKIPIGTERKKSDGMVQVKVSDKKWEYKQRLIWKQHFGEIPNDSFVIFLDGNRNNFDINNLQVVSKSEATSIKNTGVQSLGDLELTKTTLSIIKLNNVIKDKIGDKNEG